MYDTCTALSPVERRIYFLLTLVANDGAFELFCLAMVISDSSRQSSQDPTLVTGKQKNNSLVPRPENEACLLYASLRNFNIPKMKLMLYTVSITVPLHARSQAPPSFSSLSLRIVLRSYLGLPKAARGPGNESIVISVRSFSIIASYSQCPHGMKLLFFVYL